MALFSDLTYKILADSSKQMNTDPRDFLVVFASESALNPARTAGLPYRGFNAMGKNEAVEAGIDPDIWEMLPQLGDEDNMRASMQFFLSNLRKFHRNGFASPLDIYLFNFAVSMWLSNAGPDTVIYAAPSAAYYENASLDNYPALSTYAAENGIPFKNSKDIAAAAKIALRDSTILKGKITLADLRSFVVRPDLKSIWKPHVDRLTELGLAPSTPYKNVSLEEDYNPDRSWQDFANERQKRAGGNLLTPASPEASIQETSWAAWGLAAGIATAVGVFFFWMNKQPMRRRRKR